MGYHGHIFEQYCLTAVAIWYRFEKRSWRHYFSTSEKQCLSLHLEKLVFLWFFESYVRPGFERYCLTAVTIWYRFEKISWRHYFSTTEKQGLICLRGGHPCNTVQICARGTPCYPYNKTKRHIEKFVTEWLYKGVAWGTTGTFLDNLYCCSPSARPTFNIKS